MAHASLLTGTAFAAAVLRVCKAGLLQEYQAGWPYTALVDAALPHNKTFNLHPGVLAALP